MFMALSLKFKFLFICLSHFLKLFLSYMLKVIFGTEFLRVVGRGLPNDANIRKG